LQLEEGFSGGQPGLYGGDGTSLRKVYRFERRCWRSGSRGQSKWMTDRPGWSSPSSKTRTQARRSRARAIIFGSIQPLSILWGVAFWSITFQISRTNMLSSWKRRTEAL